MSPARLKVLHVIPSIAPRYGGPSQAIMDMNRALIGNDIETLIASTDADGPAHLPVNLGRVVAFGDLPVIFFRRQWSEAFKYSRSLALWLDANIASFDVVHVHAVFSHACLAASRACRKHGVPYIVRPLGTLDPWSMRHKPWRKRVFWYLGVGEMLANAAAVHYTAGEEMRLAESSLGVRRGVVIPLGVSEQFFAPGAETTASAEWGADPYVLSMSRVHPKKGLELLIRGFLGATQPADRGEVWRLVIAGDGESAYVASLKALSEELGGRDRVVFTGWLQGAAKVAALHGAALFALTSSQENFAISVAEAMASCVPVLISPQVNLAPEIERASAGWIAAMEAPELSAQIRALLGDPAERQKRGEAGHRLSRDRFRWPQIAMDLTCLYRSVARNRAARR